MFPCAGWEQGWAWLYRPVSHTEARSVTWVDPELAYDGDCATAGHVILDGSDPRLDSCFIRWFFDSVEAEGLRFKASITGEEGSVYAAELYATVDGNRVTLYPYQEGPLQLGKLWEFPKGILTEVGLDVGCSTETKVAVIIYEIAAGGKGCCFAGPLAAICNVFCEIGDWFADLADDIEGVMFVGGALSAPFRSLADTLNGLGGTCCEVSANLQEILDLLEGGISWGEISAMILDLSLIHI